MSHESIYDVFQSTIADLERQVAALTKRLDDYRASRYDPDEVRSAFQRMLNNCEDKLAASHAREQKVHNDLETIVAGWSCGNIRDSDSLRKLTDLNRKLALPQDDTALQARLKEEREKCAKVLADHPGHIPSNRWDASSALGSCEEKIRSMT